MSDWKRGLIIFTILFIIASASVSAATIYGTVYDFELNRADAVRISINTTPEQQLIAVNGRYTFTVPQGHYELKAQQQLSGLSAEATESIIIEKDGSYVRDIILYPQIDGEENITDNVSDMSGTIFDDEEQSSRAFTWTVIGVMLIILVILAYRVNKVLQRLSTHLVKQEKTENNTEVKEIQPAETIKQVTQATAVQPETKIISPEVTPASSQTAESIPQELQQVIEFIKTQEGRTTQKDIRKQFPLSEAKISLMIADLENRKIVEKIKKGRGNIIILKEMKNNGS